MITLPSTLTTVDLQHGYRSDGLIHGEHAIHVGREGNLATITLDRAPVNAFDMDQLDELERAAAELEVAGDVGCVLIRGHRIYDVCNNEGRVSVGDTADTAEFAIASIRRWWNQIGQARFPKATRLLMMADGGGSNGYRVRTWKKNLAALAAETGL
jgi:hypothetical protein